MRQERFEAERRADWADLAAILERLEAGSGARRPGAATGIRATALPALYRGLCGDYALAVSRRYSPGLIEELARLARRAHRQLYRRRTALLGPALGFMARDFPLALRRHAAAFWLAAGLLFLPMLAMGIACHGNPELIYSVMPGEQVAQLEAVYDPANRRPGRDPARDSADDFMMFGFYVMNNVGIGFRTLASGLLLGVGSAAILVLNGVSIGAAAGHLTRLEYGGTFWPFVSGHAPFELTAIAICGAAGLLLGKALIAPGRHTRLAALRANAREAVTLVGGAALMLVLAAVIEAFWSSGPAAPGLRYAVGGAGWLLVVSYLALAGGAPRGPRTGGVRDPDPGAGGGSGGRGGA
jgi:uncharacterized membrane protein SpoIIM required for sporulation